MALNRSLFRSDKDTWETPPEIFKRLDAEFHFDIDVCASADNAKCEQFIGPERDSLSLPWKGTCWMNPPYGREIGKWVEKADQRRRRFYKLTAEGRRVLVQQRETWKSFVEAMRLITGEDHA